MSGILGHVDIGRAVLALFIAIALFSAVRLEQNPPETGSFDLPVDIVNIPPGLLLVGGPNTPSVQARVSAPREEWVSLRASGLRAFVDLSKGTATLDEYPVAVDTPDTRVRIVEVIPPRIPVRLEENIERAVPVRVTRTGNVPFGYEAGEPEVEPTTVSVAGPASLVRRVEAVTVEMKLDGLTLDVDGRYTATAVDAQGQPVIVENRNVRLTPAAVRVRIPIMQQLSYKTVGVQPNIAGSVQSGYIIEGVAVEPSAVTIVGAPSLVTTINAAETERIDVSDINATFARQVSILVPAGMSVVQQDLVRVTVSISPLVLTQSFTTVPLVENVTPGVQIVSSIPSVQVVLQGPASALRGIRPGDLRASISLAGLSAGAQRADVTVDAPAGAIVQSVNPRVISVTLADETSNAPPPPPQPTSSPEPTSTPEPSPTATRTPSSSSTPTPVLTLTRTPQLP
jgi:YbbR domain-containing protein